MVSEIALGTWQIGGVWGSDFDYDNAQKILDAAINGGVNFIDTADVYSGGDSEAAVGKAVRAARSRGAVIHVATKCGRQISPHVNEGYTPSNLRRFVEDSLRRTGFETLDLIQLHCPPTQVYYRPEIFGLFEDLKREGKILNMGVSVEKVEEALKAIEFPNVSTVQIIFNMFRFRPSELFFERAAQKDVGIIVRVPLASGLLTGKFGSDTAFQAGDHRAFNRDGAAFDKGETFSGVPYEIGLQAVAELERVFGKDQLAAAALRWILGFSQVSTIIPGASRPEQLERNVAVCGQPPLTSEQNAAVTRIYERFIKGSVHQLW